MGDKKRKNKKQRRKNNNFPTFNGFCHIKIDDQGDIFDINTTTSHICCDQHVFSTCFHTSQCTFTLFLRPTAMQYSSTELFFLNAKNKILW